jgi:phage protein D
VLTAAVLALGTFGFVRSALFGGGGPSTASASVAPPLSSITNATTTTVTPSKAPSAEPSTKAKPSAKAAKAVKSTKSVKGDATVASATLAPTIKHHTPAPAEEPHKAESRKPGLDYLVVLNLRTKASAEKAREALLRKGVATTVEQDLRGQSTDRKYSLVCLTGFDPDSDRARLDKQVKRLKALKLDPKPYTWGG